MRTIDPELLAKTTRQLRAVVNARSSERADNRLFRLFTRAVRSEEHIEAVFAAVQLMRDLDKIDRAEGAFILWRLFDQMLWNELCTSKRKPDPDFDRAWREGVELDLIIAAENDRETVRAAAFLRDHGEEELADMLLNQPEEYEALWVEGEGTLIGDKPPEERPVEPATSPASAQVFSECILALATTESLKDWVQAWKAVCRASREVAPADAVAAIQSLREIGGISYEDSVSFIHRTMTFSLMGTGIRCLVESPEPRGQRGLTRCFTTHGVRSERGCGPLLRRRMAIVRSGFADDCLHLIRRAKK